MSGASMREHLQNMAAEHKKALVVYMTHGDPSVGASLDLMKTFADSGADVIELGVPFSDPAADGVVIQEAMERALLAGSGLQPALDTVRAFRDAGYTTAVVLFGYYNPIYVYGVEAFAQAASSSGVDAVLTVDLPLEELGELFVPLRKKGVGVIPLLAPTSTEERIQKVGALKPPFVYYVSMTGVTGASFQGASGGVERVALIRANTKSPVCVGFGIKTGEEAQSVAAYADGVVVGSALVLRIAESATISKACESVATLTQELRSALAAMQ